MENFEINKNLCILWVDKCHDILIKKINTENNFLEKLVNDEFNFSLTTLESKNRKLL
jgi:hypothetical protein